MRIKVADIVDDLQKNFMRIDFGITKTYFDLMIRQHGIWSRIEKSSLCTCFDDFSRKPDPTCTRCYGIGRFWFPYTSDYVFYFNTSSTSRDLDFSGTRVDEFSSSSNCVVRSNIILSPYDRLKPEYMTISFQLRFSDEEEREWEYIDLPYDPTGIEFITTDDGIIPGEDIVLSHKPLNPQNPLKEESRIYLKRPIKSKALVVKYYARPFWFVIESRDFFSSQVSLRLPRDYYVDYPKFAVLRRSDTITLI